MVNIATEVWKNADAVPDKVAVRSGEQSLTYAQLRAINEKVAGAVRDAGVRPDERVLLIAPSVLAFPAVYYGLHAAGVVVVTMNVMSTKAEIEYVAEDSDVRLVIAWHANADNARAVANGRRLPLWIIDADSPFGGAPFEDAVPSEQPHEHGADDACLVLYTSGTTGRPKGAQLTASNLVAVVPSLSPVLDLTADDRFGTGLPLFHVFGQCVVMNSTLATGATLSLLSPFDPKRMIGMTLEHELTAVAGVPTMWNAMLHASEGYTPEDFANLRLAASGGASLPVEVIRAFKEKLGCTILEGYGLTETTGCATFNDMRRPTKPGTVGPALPGSAVEVRSFDGDVLPPDEVGEVFVKGPMVFASYLNRPEATAETLRDGWMHTGDLGALDADGYLRIVDRTKDLIIRGGYNVYPREVEEVLYAHPGVVEAAVVGVPHDHYGEEVAAVVVLAPGAKVAAVDLDSYVREQLSAYKVPRVYDFVEALPKGATGKILKRAIVRPAFKESDAL